MDKHVSETCTPEIDHPVIIKNKNIKYKMILYVF